MERMQSQEIRDAVAQALAAGGFASAEQAAWEVSLTVALAKLSGYERECECFRKRYGGPLDSLRSRVEGVMGREDFSLEDDLADWEFAEAARGIWEQRAEILRNAAA
jgi:hypothetical protein